MAAALLTASHCTARYEESGPPVFAGVDLGVDGGELVTVVGRSGSGKSTLLLVLSGLKAPSEGTVVIDDRLVRRGDPGVGLVLQHYGLFPWFTVLENVTLGLTVRGRRRSGQTFARPGAESRTDIESRARAALGRLGLDGKESRYPRELSGGEQQRVALARTLLLEPRVLLLDEPFSALDALTREELQDQLLDLLHGSQMAAVMVTHSIDEAVYLGDRVGILVDADGPARLELTANPVPPRRPADAGRRTSGEYLRACVAIRRRFREVLGA